MNTTPNATKHDRTLTELLDQVDAAAATASLASDLDYPAQAIREVEEAYRLLRSAADLVAKARRRERERAALPET